MEPREVVEVIERHYWVCEVAEHHHKTLGAAQRCMQAAARKAERAAIAAVEAKQQWDKFIRIAREVLEGAEYAEVADRLGCSPSHIRNCVVKALWRCHRHAVVQHAGLSPDMVQGLKPYGKIRELRAQSGVWLRCLDALEELRMSNDYSGDEPGST